MPRGSIIARFDVRNDALEAGKLHIFDNRSGRTIAWTDNEDDAKMVVEALETVRDVNALMKNNSEALRAS